MGRPLLHPVNRAPDGEQLIARAVLRARIRLLLADPRVAAGVAFRLRQAPSPQRNEAPGSRHHPIGSEGQR